VLGSDIDLSYDILLTCSVS